MEDEIIEYLEEYQKNRKDNLFETIYRGWLKQLEFPDSPYSLYIYLQEEFYDIDINPISEELGGNSKVTKDTMTLVYKDGNVSNKVINLLNPLLKQLL